MDINDLKPIEETQEQKLEFDQVIIENLENAAKWSKFIAIVGFVMLGLMVLMGFFFGTIISSFSGMSNVEGVSAMPFQGFGIVMGIVYLFVALIYFFPLFYLFNFSTNTRKAIMENDTAYMINAFSNLRKHFQYIGILIIIGLSLYALALLAGLFTSAIF